MDLVISIVSHGQLDIAKNLLADIEEYCPKENLKIILTLNFREDIPEKILNAGYISVVINKKPKGFGKNHNQAFELEGKNAEYFAVLNPDVRLEKNIFPELISALEKSSAGVIAPLIINSEGEPEDSAREFLTPWRLLKRVRSKIKKKYSPVSAENPDWVAGMFMLFPTKIYKEITGFDEGYYLYCEDMDMCLRLRRAGYKILWHTQARAIHDARRESHKKLKYLYWHCTSLLRFFCRFYTTYRDL